MVIPHHLGRWSCGLFVANFVAEFENIYGCYFMVVIHCWRKYIYIYIYYIYSIVVSEVALRHIGVEMTSNFWLVTLNMVLILEKWTCWDVSSGKTNQPDITSASKHDIFWPCVFGTMKKQSEKEKKHLPGMASGEVETLRTQLREAGPFPGCVEKVFCVMFKRPFNHHLLHYFCFFQVRK